LGSHGLSLRLGPVTNCFANFVATLFRTSSVESSAHPRGLSGLELCLAKGCGRRYGIRMEKVVTRDPEILGGEPVFAGTRVPIKSLFDHLEAGDSIADFLEGFPSVAREQVLALLEESKAHAMANQ
jgi:uncharacterized protein (DUF433 family)